MRWNRYRHCAMVALALMLFFSSGLSRAQDSDSTLRNRLVLPELIQEVLARNPELVATRKQWEVATSRITQAGSLDDPILSVQLWNFPQSFNATRSDNSIFGLSQSLPFPGKRTLKSDVASRSADMTEQLVRAKERELVARLKQAYYDLFLAQKAVQIHHEQVELLRQFVEIANAKFRAGKGSQADVLKAQVELSLLFQHRPVLEQRRETAEAKLNTLLDRTLTSPLGLAQEPSQLSLDQPIDDLHRLALNDRPEIKAAELDVQRNEQSHALAERQYYPDFNVAFQRFQNYQANDGFGAYVAMSIPFAFWTKPKYDAGVQEAAAAVAVARAQQHTAENMTRFQINDLLAKLRATDQVATLYRTTILPQAEQSLEAARVGYRAGKAGFLDLIDTQRAWRGFQLEYFTALVDRQHRLAELEQVVGIALDRQS
ncbi:MAG: TolC family protein [Nitrospiraceae bacterium]|nr:TolC family protein [Nitrospiraceae bacterium]